MDWTNSERQKSEMKPSPEPADEGIDEYMKQVSTKKSVAPKTAEKKESNEHLQIQSEVGRKVHANLIKGLFEIIIL
jgi:hypothetical protein